MLKFQKFFSIFSTLVVLLLIGYVVYRLYLSMKEDTGYSSYTAGSLYLDKKHSGGVPRSSLYFDKGQVILPFEGWQVLGEEKKQPDIQPGKSYHLVQNLDNRYRCYLGYFYLIGQRENAFVFRGSRSDLKSKLMQYAKIQQKLVRVELRETLGVRTDKDLMTCHEWVSLDEEK